MRFQTALTANAVAAARGNGTEGVLSVRPKHPRRRRLASEGGHERRMSPRQV